MNARVLHIQKWDKDVEFKFCDELCAKLIYLFEAIKCSIYIYISIVLCHIIYTFYAHLAKDWKNLDWLSNLKGVSRHNGGPIEISHKPVNTIVLLCRGFLRGPSIRSTWCLEGREISRTAIFFLRLLA